MPALSLVVCLNRERELLQRLLHHSAGCYDDLVVIHDGPDTRGIRGVVETAGGRFFERPQARHQEPHWPFAWEQAAHDWILRLDADEFPSDEMKGWLQQFRAGTEPVAAISGYTCCWPLWDGKRTVTRKWPAGRLFLFHRQRVRYFAMPEQVPIPDGNVEPLALVLHHQPPRKSYGIQGVVIRKQAYLWREQITSALMGKPTDLNCWRWQSEAWPEGWEQIRRHPFSTALRRLTRGTLATIRDQWRKERRLIPVAVVVGPLHHAMICIAFWNARRKRRQPPQFPK